MRSSRLRDRQKEEREFLVKQAFIEDMLQENKLLSILLGKEAAKRAVLWNAELLPDSSKGFQLPDLTSPTGTSVANMPNISSAKKSGHYLLDDEMSLYMDSLTNIDIGGDDLPYHFETDSGALACVGCGILGFPFMAVIQPTEKLTMELPDNHLIQVSSSDSTAGLHSSISRNTFVLYHTVYIYFYYIFMCRSLCLFLQYHGVKLNLSTIMDVECFNFLSYYDTGF